MCLETELWPNLISSLHKFNTKIILINGRVSKRSYLGYKKIGFVTSCFLRKFFLILMQSEQDAVRMLTLGAPKDKVFVTGNLKFDLAFLESGAKRKEIRESLNISDEEILLIAGSTHKGEEEDVVECFLRLKKEYASLRLLIAPRHVERTQEIIKLLSRHGFESVRFSFLNVSTLHSSPSTLHPVFILYTIGDLKSIYSAADIVFVGGSLVKKGGQNPIEPASLAKPVIFGKFTFNFNDVINSFLENGAGIQVDNKDELCSAIRFLVNDPKERRRLGINAKDTVTKNSGSSQRTIDLILSTL